jgi:hypothetical protein
MKKSILSLAICSTLATLAQAAQNSSNPNGVPEGVTVVAPGITYSATAFPWQSKPSVTTGQQLNRLLTDLRDDIETMAPTLAALKDSASSGPPPEVAESEAAQYASGNTVLPAKDLSTLASQDLSANLGQNLSTSLAVPTSVPWSTWGNGPGMVLANVGGAVVAAPTFPPRTAWGNGPGVVVTTPGGAVFTMAPGTASVANPSVSRDVLHQLSVVQDDLDRVVRYLATMNQTNAAPPTAPGQPPVYLNPTGR